ncbi:hypothetical protein Phum_PHUM354830 [Pediculus humanus corporis]|uniref:MYND-type domain-containing protein n=1 Tax=Pediculus humanus subsp. corporis TaxID=121224 RepID=E0VP96_PEDHC|nr:uncharacterized protein Phum_PHUM354830 [Pediculus humanus corporis]EEB15202.1 hypothetical protein Phum_PHUM354830 [Pediculus humanus corporis]
MEEGNAKVTADAAELPKTQPDLPKKANTVVKTLQTLSANPVEEPKTPTTPPLAKINGSSEKLDLDKKPDEPEIHISSTTTLTTVQVKKEPDGKVDSLDADEKEKEKEKCSEVHDLTVTCTPSFENVSKTSQNEKHYSNNKIISISVEQCQTNNVGSVNCVSEESSVDKLKKPKPITNRKRSNKSTDSEESYKYNFKRTKFPEIDHEDRERTVSDYVEKASGSSLEELQMNTEKLQQEIHSLSALARAKELEWNDIIRLKKVKEEIYLRLVRRKQVMLLSMGGPGRTSDPANWEFASDHRMAEFVGSDEVTFNRVAPSVSPKPPPRLPSNLTITKSQSSPSQNLQRFLMQPQGASDHPKPNTSLMMVPIVSSTPISISSSSSYLPRSHVGTPLKIPVPDRDKLKSANNRNVPVPILPKPNQNVNHVVNNHSPPIGRQGPIVDVKSIIADYRQNHPEQVPRRGRRPKGQPSQNFAETMVSSGRGVLSMSSLALGSGAQVRTMNSNPELVPGSMGQNAQDTSRPSSTDSNRSASNAPTEIASASGVSFKDVLVQFAKMSQHQQGDRRNSTPSNKSQALSKAPPYPEVTLHPVLPAGAQSPPNPSSSLLHGILTKNNGNVGARGESQGNSKSTSFSPTLARLLTTPDRSSLSTTITTALRGSSTNTTASRLASGPVSIADLLSTSKNRNELTITPIISNLQPAKIKEDVGNASDEDPDDNADRLVIDESEEQEVRGEDEEEIDSETVPECQGCHMKSAQFVCAGCGNQWYCSRNCQVTAWDEHSEVCSG